jgi:AraC-like DNA-binding protein
LIAAGVGSSVRYLADLFVGEGTTVMAWMKKRRLEMTRMAPEGTAWEPGAVADAAYRHGFSTSQASTAPLSLNSANRRANL